MKAHSIVGKPRSRKLNIVHMRMMIKNEYLVFGHNTVCITFSSGTTRSAHSIMYNPAVTDVPGECDGGWLLREHVYQSIRSGHEDICRESIYVHGEVAVNNLPNL